MPGKEQNNNFGIASLVLGISSVVFCWVPFLGLITGVLAIVFYAQQKKKGLNGVATGGLVTGIVGLVFSVLWTMFWISFVSVIV